MKKHGNCQLTNNELEELGLYVREDGTYISESAISGVDGQWRIQAYRAQKARIENEGKFWCMIHGANLRSFNKR